MNLPLEMKSYLENTVAELNLRQHPYFHGLLSGQFSKDQFLDSQNQFSYLVKYFARPMAAVIANMPNAITRSAIVANLWEEHGRGDHDKIHGKTILTLIDRLGGDSDKLDEKYTSESIRIFNTALRGISVFEDYRVSAAVFGGIERTFVDISTLICEAIIERGWLPRERITHYALHKEIDIKHAEEFLEVTAEDWNRDEESRELIRRGIRMGARLFTNVYSDFAADAFRENTPRGNVSASAEVCSDPALETA